LADIIFTIFPIKIISQSGFSEDNLLDKLPGSHKLSFNIEINTIKEGGGNSVYNCYVAYKKKILWIIPVNVVLANGQYNAPNGSGTLDTYPGGTTLLKKYVDESTLPLSEDNNVLYFSTYKLEIKSGFSFVPTASALDIGKCLVPLINADYYASYVGAMPPAAPKNTPFANFITAYSNGTATNEEHITFTKRNGNWLAQELINQNPGPQANCAMFCGINNQSILGPGTLCGNTTYSITNLPVGAMVTWYASGGIQVNGVNNQPSVSIKHNYKGLGTLSAKISIPNFECGDKWINKIITASGAPTSQDISGQYFNNGGLDVPSVIYNPDVYPITGIMFSVPAVNGVSYQWQVNGTTYGSLKAASVVVYLPDCGYGFPSYKIFQAKVTMTNACGTTVSCKEFQFNCSPIKSLQVLGSCNSGGVEESIVLSNNQLIVYPNPANTEISISVPAAMSVESIAPSNEISFEVKLYSSSGKLLLTKSNMNNEPLLTLNTQALPTGNYYLHVSYNNQVLKKQILIQH
jgi:hypothetical protein